MPARKEEGLKDFPAARQTRDLWFWSQTAGGWVPRNTTQPKEKGPENGDDKPGGRLRDR